MPADDEKQKTAAEAKCEEQKTTNDERLATFTENLFWATVALSTVAVLQLFVFGWQGVQLKRAVQTAREATDLGTKEFIATHRPKIKIRYIDTDTPHRGQKQTAKIHAANIGESDAVFKEFGLDIFTRARGRAQSGHFNAVPKAWTLTIEPGKQADISFAADALSYENVTEIIRGTLDICLIGIINYSDNNSMIRSTSFFRIYDPARKRFVKASPTDEYAELEYESSGLSKPP